MNPLRILIVEDSQDDTELIAFELRRGGYEPVYERVETSETMKDALEKKTWDIISADYSMPHFNGNAALEVLKKTGLDIPFILVSGKIGEETAVEIVKLGAYDYILKDNLVRLVPAVERALADAKTRESRKRAEEELREREAFNFALFQYNPMQILVVDLEGKVVMVNLAKKSSGDRLPNIGDVMYRDYAGKHEIDMHAELLECIRSGKTKEFSEEKYGEKFLFITISPFSQGAIIISKDITEHKQADELLHRRNEELERTSKLTVGRELRMIALKKEINALLQELGRDPQYKIAE